MSIEVEDSDEVNDKTCNQAGQLDSPRPPAHCEHIDRQLAS